MQARKIGKKSDGGVGPLKNDDKNNCRMYADYNNVGLEFYLDYTDGLKYIILKSSAKTGNHLKITKNMSWMLNLTKMTGPCQLLPA